MPKRFTISWVVTAVIVLFSTIVNEGDSFGGEREDSGVSQLGITIRVVVKETSVVVVVNKDTEGSDIAEVGSLLVVAALNVTHPGSISENIVNSVVHRVIKEGSDGALVASNIRRVSVEALTHLEDSTCWPKFTPEIFTDLRDSVNSDPIEAIIRYEISNPGLELGSDICVVLIQIGQVSQAAVLNVTLVIPVGDLAVGVVVYCLVVGGDLSVVSTDRSHVIGNNINHNPDSFGVGGVNEVFKLLSSAEVRVDLVPVFSPVAMVSTRRVSHNRRNPNSVKSHSSDVVELICDTNEGSTTVI